MTDRLYYLPDHTEKVLRKATSGASTIEDLADMLGHTPKITSNKAHDPVVLGSIERDDYQLSVSEDARRVVQLEDTTPLKNAFTELPGVQEVLDRIEKEPIDVEEAGYLISFNTDSNAAAGSTFKNYGRVYARWIDYLGLGSYLNGVVAAGSIENLQKKKGLWTIHEELIVLMSDRRKYSKFFPYSLQWSHVRNSENEPNTQRGKSRKLCRPVTVWESQSQLATARS